MTKDRLQSNRSSPNLASTADVTDRDYTHYDRNPRDDTAALELIYKTAPIGLAVLSLDCRYVMINEHLTEICGISAADHIGRSVREMVPQVADQVEQLVNTICLTGQPITGVEVNGQRPDGSNVNRVWITYWHPLKNRNGTVIGVNVAAEEITQRKRVESELASSQERLRVLNSKLAERLETQARERDRLWNLSRDLLIVSDLKGGVLDVNPAWSSMLGWSANELIGKNADWLVHPGDRERSLAERRSLVAGQQTRHFEARIKCKDGSYRWISWSAVPDNGLVYASGRDITDRKQTQEQMHTLRRQLADASRQSAVDTLIASIVHEIRQPLTAIVMSAHASVRWLKDSNPNIANACAALDRTVKAAQQLDEVVVDLRATFAREAREASAIDLRLLVTDVLKLTQIELEKHQVLLRNDISESLPKIQAVRVQLQQVILNLITNAIDAMSSVNERDRCLTIASTIDGSASITITIEDTGSGIEPAHLDRIFDRFYTTKSDGMGLGLSISRSIVEAHGGRLTASPRSPFGTIFHLTLPVIPGGSKQLGEAGSEAKAS